MENNVVEFQDYIFTKLKAQIKGHIYVKIDDDGDMYVCIDCFDFTFKFRQPRCIEEYAERKDELVTDIIRMYKNYINGKFFVS